MQKVEPFRTKKEINAMKKALNGRDRLMFIMGVSFGLRISDLLKFKFGDFRKSNGEIVDKVVVKEEKTSKSREIFVSKSVKSELAKLADEPDDEYIFRSRQGGNKPISRVRAYQILNDAAKRAGLSDKIGAIGCHSLRKTFGLALYNQGLDITRIMVILGHSSPAVTLRYIGVTDTEIQQAYEAIEV